MQVIFLGCEIVQLVSLSRICAVGSLRKKGDILHQLPRDQKAFQSTSFHTVCLQMQLISESFQNFSDLEQSIFLKGLMTLSLGM